MRKFVEKISERAKAVHPGFLVVPQNGLELLTSDGTINGNPSSDYISAIDGVGQEELWYGYDNNDDTETPVDVHSDLMDHCRFAEQQGLKVMITDYTTSQVHTDDSYAKNSAAGFISFAADHRDLDNIPAYPSAPFTQQPPQPFTSFSTAGNFLYIINPSAYSSKTEFVNAVTATAYDVIVMDLDFDEQSKIDSADLNHIRSAHPGRKILCYMSIGEAESYRSYWKPYWRVTPPDFLTAEDPYWPDNYNVRYWNTDWQEIICGRGDSYLNRIISAGFDGVYLDLVSEFEFFEE